MATNENVNKVIYGNQTVMDITDTTAEESDVASGEVFYKANGARSVGTANMDSVVWGQITGDIDDQSDLQTEIAKKVIRLTQAEYNALSSAEKHDTKKVYYIYDYSPAPITLINDAVTSLTSTWSSSKLSDDLDDKVDKVSGKGLSTNDYTSAEKTKLAGLQNYDDTEIRSMIPTATSQLTNNSGFITNAVNNLVNYYLKTETYTKEEVNSLISTLSGIHFEYVATLPTEDIQTNAIYLVPKADTQTRNVKEEYINLDGTTSGWEKIGDTEIDLSDYVTITQLNTALASYVTSSAFTTALATKSTQVRITKAQYDALTNEEKHDTTKVYYITDYTPMPVNAELNDTVTASNKVWSSQKVASELSGLIEDISDNLTVLDNNIDIRHKSLIKIGNVIFIYVVMYALKELNFYSVSTSYNILQISDYIPSAVTFIGLNSSKNETCHIFSSGSGQIKLFGYNDLKIEQNNTIVFSGFYTINS